MADAAGGAVAATQGEPADGTTPQPGETKAQAIARYKADLGDGEREYDRTHLEGLAKKGRESARLMSAAQKRAEEASKKEQEAEARLSVFKSKDLKAIRKTLKEMGVNDLDLANDVGQEKLREMDMTPEQRRIAELEAKEAERLQQDDAAKKKEEEGRQSAEVERHKNELAGLFIEGMKAAKIPKAAASVAFPRLARLYSAADAAGETLSPEQAGEYMRAGLMEEHKSLYSRPGEKPGEQVLDVDALEANLTEWFGEGAWKEINRRAVAKYRAARGQATQPVVAPQGEPTAPERQGRPRKFDWKALGKNL